MVTMANPTKKNNSEDACIQDRHHRKDDHLVALKPLEVSKCNSFSDLLEAYKYTAFAARSTGEAADILHEMTTDKDCFVVLTLSGAMTIAKMGLVACDMIDNGMVDAVVSTGALMAHGFIESAGMDHYKYNPHMNDEALYQKGYNRVYDTLEPESNFDKAYEIFTKVMSTWNTKETASSFKINKMLGEYLHKNVKGRGILKSAFEQDIPVYIPAFTDSEMGLDFALLRREFRAKGSDINYDPFIDLEDYTSRILDAKKIGIFTIGGGVPRNWAQQVGPYLDLIRWRLSKKAQEKSNLKISDDGKESGSGHLKKFNYAVRICPEPTHFGGLSGCTFSEGVSWGKFVPEKEGGKFAEVYADATLAWPLVIKAVLERMGK